MTGEADVKEQMLYEVCSLFTSYPKVTETDPDNIRDTYIGQVVSQELLYTMPDHNLGDWFWRDPEFEDEWFLA